MNSGRMGIGLFLLGWEECFQGQVVVAVAFLQSKEVNAVLLSDQVSSFRRSSILDEC